MIHVFMHDNFYDRISFILVDRKPHAWGRACGIGRGSINRIFNERIVPTHEALTPIARYENASLNWLLHGQGSPYFTVTCIDDQQARHYAEDVLVESGWTGYLISDGERIALAFAMPGEYEIKGSSYQYTILELMVGNIGRVAAESILASSAVRWRYRVEVSHHEMDAIVGGQVGTYRLLLAKDALLKTHVVHTVSSASTDAVIDERLPARGILTSDAELMNKIRMLSDEQKRAIASLIDSMLPHYELRTASPTAQAATGSPETKYKL